MKAGKVILSVVLGAAGVAIGVLFAPQKGARTRRRIKERGEDYLLALEDLKNDYERSLQNFKRNVDSAYVDIESKIKGLIQEKEKSGQDTRQVD